MADADEAVGLYDQLHGKEKNIGIEVQRQLCAPICPLTPETRF